MTSTLPLLVRESKRLIKCRVLGQYREMGVLLWRGFTYDEVMAQCFGNHEDASTKGKQMPVVSPGFLL